MLYGGIHAQMSPRGSRDNNVDAWSIFDQVCHPFGDRYKMFYQPRLLILLLHNGRCEDGVDIVGCLLEGVWFVCRLVPPVAKIAVVDPPTSNKGESIFIGDSLPSLSYTRCKGIAHPAPPAALRMQGLSNEILQRTLQ